MAPLLIRGSIRYREQLSLDKLYEYVSPCFDCPGGSESI